MFGLPSASPTRRALILGATVVALVLGVGTSLARAQDFKNEAAPLFDNCGDPSYREGRGGRHHDRHLALAALHLDQPRHAEGRGPRSRDRRGRAGTGSGINKIKYEVMPFGQLISALLAKRIDVVAAIHVTPDRLKVISFTGPAYWYGPALLVKKGNPDGITVLRRPQGQEDRRHRRIGGRRISAHRRRRGRALPDRRRGIQRRLHRPGQRDPRGRHQGGAVPEGQSDSAPMEMVTGIAVPDELIFKYGYGYVRVGAAQGRLLAPCRLYPGPVRGPRQWQCLGAF